MPYSLVFSIHHINSLTYYLKDIAFHLSVIMLEGLYAFYSRVYDIVQTLRGLNSTTVPDEFVPGSDLRGKWVIVTGGNSGIGFEAAKSFASWGASIILACRDPPSHEQHPTDAVKACQKIIQEHGHSSVVEWWEIDMADLSTVESFCQKWLETGRALDILCNNAGIPGTNTPTLMTKDGFQITHQVRFIAFKWFHSFKLKSF